MDSAILTQEALRLSAWERAQVIDALWQSLDPVEQTAIDQAWLAKSRDRLQAYREGKLKAEDGEATLNAIEAQLSQ